MNFNNKLPERKNSGTEPSDSLKNDGFKAGYKPSANVFNWFWNKTGKCIKELQEKLSCAPIPLSGVCTTAKGTTGKVVTCPDFKIYDGARIAVTFNNGNSANYMTLNVNGTGAYFAWFPIGTSRAYNNELISKFIVAGCTYEFIYQDGATPKWVYCGMTSIPINDETPTYTEAEERDNLASGEKLSTAFGKIKKWFADLKAVAFSNDYNDLDNTPTALKNPNALTLSMNGTSTSYTGESSVAKTWYAPTTAGTAGYIPISNGSGAPAWRQPDYYGVCSTEGATRDKVVDIPNFKLVNGVRIRVKFTYSHAILASGTNARLNVSNTGAKTVYLANKLVRGYYGVPNASSADTSMYPNTWDENEVIEFWYDGSSWRSIPETHILDPLDVKLVRASWVTWNTAGNTTYLPKFLNKIIRSCDFFADYSNAASIIQEALRHTANAGRLSIITTYGNSYFTIDDNIYIAESQTESSLRAPRKVTIEGRSMVSTSKARLDFKNNCSIKNGGATSPQLTLKNLELQLYWGIGVGVQNTTFINLGTGNGSVLILENCDISISESQVSELPAFIADTIIMKNCNYSLEATEHSQYMCYSGIRCNRLEIDGGSISITNDCSNTINPDNFELNFIYGSNVTGYIKNCTINGAGSYRVSIIDSPYIEVATCDITLGNKASLCHYTTSTEKIYTALRDCTINYTASTYLTFGKITGCTFKNSSTGYTTDAYKLQVLCPAQITNNAFVGRSEMNFNGNKVLFTNNILQYSQSYTTFPTGSVNANNMVSG